MESTSLSEYLSLCEQIKKLKLRQTELQNDILEKLTKGGKESINFQNKIFSTIQKCKYAFNTSLIYSVLHPKKLFSSVIRIDKKSYDDVLCRPSLLSEAELEQLLGAVTVLSVQALLSVRNG